VFVKLLPDVQVMLSVDQVKFAEKEFSALAPASTSATLLSVLPTQSVLLTITKDSANVMLDLVEHLTAELDVFRQSRDVQMMLSAKKLKSVE
jgi:hypothetical protein